MTRWNTLQRDLLLDIARYTGTQRPSLVNLIIKLFHNSGLIFSLLYRVERYLFFHPLFVLRAAGYVLYPLYFTVTYYVLDYHIAPYVNIGGGLFLHNRSIVIYDQTTIGRNASIMGQVTIGTGFDPNHFLIHIGNNVKIGAGAKIITSGSLTIADNVVIGANAVVTKNITSAGVYAGVPVKRLR